MRSRKPAPAPTAEELAAGRPKAGDPPELGERLEVLRELLAIERRRLVVALRIEEERRIVFPETTVIIRDIERLLAEVERRELGDDAPAGSAGGMRPAGGLRAWAD